MSRDPRLYLEDIQPACRKIVQYTAGMSRPEFLGDDKTYDAVIRNLEIIGEAAKNVPEEIQNRYALIQWREMIALRNIVVMGMTNPTGTTLADSWRGILRYMYWTDQAGFLTDL